MRSRTAAEIAEMLVSPAYREVVNNSYEHNPGSYLEQQLTAEEIIFDAFQARTPMGERIWETRRQAALAEARGADLGQFDDFIQDLGGSSAPSTMTIDDLDKGRPEAVQTNGRILGISSIQKEPIDFIEGALLVLSDRKDITQGNVGPENYATTFKLFADKYRELPTTHLDLRIVKELVDETLEGFMDAAEGDKLNFVEMTNVYSAIRTLPAATIDRRFSLPLVNQSLEVLPTYNKETLALSRAALAKLELEDVGKAAATYIDLSMRKGGAFETTRDMRRALRSVGNLPPSLAANRAFGTFLDVRNQLEQPLDVEGADDVTEQLVRIVRNVIDSPKLTLEAQDLARTCTIRAIEVYNQENRDGDLTARQLRDLGTTVKRIGKNYQDI